MMNGLQAKLKVTMLLVLLLTLTACAGTDLHGTSYNPPTPIPDFTLHTADGPVARHDFDGQYTLIYFGYSFCPDVCPLTLSELRTVYDATTAANIPVKIIFISVDPGRDSPTMAQQYAASFHPDFIGLSGEQPELEAAMQPFGAHAEKESLPGSAVEYLVNHTSRVYLLDKTGQLILSYAFGFDPNDIITDLKHLQQEE